MAKRDKNRFRKTYPYLRRKPVFENITTGNVSDHLIEIGLIGYDKTHTGTHSFTTAFTKVPKVVVTVIDNGAGERSGNINAFVTAVSTSSLTVEVSISNFTGNVMFQAIEEP